MWVLITLNYIIMDDVYFLVCYHITLIFMYITFDSYKYG